MPAFLENLGRSNVTLTAAGGAFGHEDSPVPAFLENLGRSNVTLTAASGAFGHEDSPVPAFPVLENLGRSNVTLTAAGGALVRRMPKQPESRPSINLRIAALKSALAARPKVPPVRVPPKRPVPKQMPSERPFTSSKAAGFFLGE